jgi:creatinine amidohydrolase
MASTSQRALANLSWTEAAEVLRSHPVGLLPIGAIEAHGSHLPLDTDIIIARATADAAAGLLAQHNIPAVILPEIAYTVSFVGTSFPGTSPVVADAFLAYLKSLLLNLAGQGYRALVCCNAHLEPAHVETIQTVCDEVEQETGIPVRSPDQRQPDLATRLGEEFAAGSRHAGSYETSIVMAARPDAVRTDLLATLPPVWIDLPAQLRAGARTFLEAGSELGYFGDPARATAEEGLRHLETLAAFVLECLHDLRESGQASNSD